MAGPPFSGRPLGLPDHQFFGLLDQAADQQSGLAGSDVAIVKGAVLDFDLVREPKFLGDLVLDRVRDDATLSRQFESPPGLVFTGAPAGSLGFQQHKDQALAAIEEM